MKGMKHIFFGGIIGTVLLIGTPCIGRAQSLTVKSDLLLWAFGYANIETEWILSHPYSYNFGYSFSMSQKNQTRSGVWLDVRYWFSGRATLGSALAGGVTYLEQTRPIRNETAGSEINHTIQFAGIRGHFIHCFTLSPHWSLEASIGNSCTLASKGGFHNKIDLKISMMYIIQ